MSDLVGLDMTATLLTAAEDAAPSHAVAAVAGELARIVGAGPVRFLIADAAGNRLVDHLDTRVGVPLEGSTPGRAWREQRLATDRPHAYVPVTVRGDALGVLDVELPRADHWPAAAEPDGGTLDARLAEVLGAVAHTLGYVLIANQRHTDVYETAMRSTDFTLTREVQRRLLPPGFVCEGGAFTLSCWIEPSASAGGDTFDYVASTDRLTASLTDAVGHVRCACSTPATRGACCCVTVRSPPSPARRVRRWGSAPASTSGQEVELRRGDRLLLMTDGMFERSAANLDLPTFLRATSGRNARNVAQELPRAFLDVVGDVVQDDAALLLLDWHGGSTRRRTHAGADTHG